MQTKYGCNVKFNQDLNIAFDANLIDGLEAYNFSEKKLTKCEHWGWSDFPHNDFGIIADFDFEINSKRTLFYFGESLTMGFYENNRTVLVILKRGAFVPRKFIETGSFNFNMEFASPKTMLDLAKCIDEYLAIRLSKIVLLKKNHQQEYSIKKNNKILIESELDDLPF